MEHRAKWTSVAPNFLRIGADISPGQGISEHHGPRKAGQVGLERDEITAEARGQWLAALAVALDEAQRLTARLVRWRPGSAEAILLRVHILAVRTEVELLQRLTETDPDAGLIDPLWLMSNRLLDRPHHDPVP